MRYNGKFLFGLLALVFLLGCTQPPEQRAKDATVLIITADAVRGTGIGSGFFVEPDKIATNIHVVAGTSGIKIVGKDRYNIERVIGFDAAHDLVILQVSGKQKGTPLPLNNCQIGEPIFVAGHPKGGKYKIAGGIVHGNSNTKIRLDARVLPGNSGGPVLNIKGELVGVVVSVQGVNAIFSNAISSDVLKVLLKKSKSKQGQSLDEWQKEDSIRAYVYASSGTDKAVDDKYEEAIEDYNKAIELYQDFTEAYTKRGVVKYRLGNSNKKNGDVKKARILYEEAIEDLTKNLDDTYAYYQLANVKSDLGNLEANSKDGNAEKAQKHYQDAISDYSTAIDKQNRDYPVSLESSYFYRAVTNLHLSHLKGQSEEGKKTWSEGVEDLTKAFELGMDKTNTFKPYPNSANDQYIRGLMEFLLGQSKASQGDAEKSQKHYENAYQFYDKAVKLNSDNVEAYSYYNKTIDLLNHDSAETYLIRGTMKANLGRFKTKNQDVSQAQIHYRAAIEDFKKTIELKPGNVYVYNNLGYTKYLLGEIETELGNVEKARGLYKEAIDYSEEAMQRDSRHANAYNLRAFAKAALKDYDGAIADLNRAIELKPNFSGAYWERGLAYQKIGKEKKAEADFKKAKELDPNVGK